MSRQSVRQAAPVLTVAIALIILSFILGAMTASTTVVTRPHYQPTSMPACTTVAEVDASGNDAYVDTR